MSKSDMIHKGIEFAIRAGLGRDQWTALIYYPSASNEGKNATVVRVSGTGKRPRQLRVAGLTIG